MNTPEGLFADVRALCQSATPQWLGQVRQVLCTVAPEASLPEVFARLPTTANSDAYFQLQAVLRQAQGVMHWAELGWSLAAMAYTQVHPPGEPIELVWTGPRPVPTSTLRRLDQALYDLILNAQRAILLVTFAAAKITRLKAALQEAAQRGVAIQLILEFGDASAGQLSRDALIAFAGSVEQQAAIYYWPLEQRERNAHGKPGKLHAKCAVVDDAVLISSANLTDDAFKRNIEIGVLLRVPALAEQLTRHFQALIEAGVLNRLIENE